MKKIIVLFVMMLVVCSSWAVKPTDWSGRVTDEMNRPLAYVNVVFLSLPDSAFIQGATTGEDGTFLLHTEQSADDVLARIPGMMRLGDKLQVIGRGTPVYYINGQERALYEQHRITLSLKYRFNTAKSRYKGNGAAGSVIKRM